jgi:hypothetical protein
LVAILSECLSINENGCTYGIVMNITVYVYYFYFLDPVTKSTLSDAIMAENNGKSETTVTLNETPAEESPGCSTSTWSTPESVSSCSSSSSSSEQVDNYFWPNLQEHHKDKFYPEKDLEIFFLDSPESTKCFSELYSPWEKGENKMSRDSIQVSNDMYVSVEEFHNLLLQRIENLHLE